MKKSRIVLVALAVLMVFVAVSCKEPHVHSYGDPQVKDGKVVQVCECGEVKEVENAVAVEDKDGLKKAIEDGSKTIYLAGDVEVAKAEEVYYVFSKDAKINLNGHTLTLHNPIDLKGSEDAFEVVFSNGKLVMNVSLEKDAYKNGDKAVTLGLGYNAVNVGENGTFTMDGVELISNIGGLFAVNNNNNTAINVLNKSKVSASGYYGIGTNASNPTAVDVTIKIENSEVVVEKTDKNEGDTTGLLFNVKGHVEIVNSKITAHRQAVILRTGEGHMISNSILVSTGDNIVTSEYTDGNWKTGNEVPLAVLVIGNRNSGAYEVPTSVTLKDVSIQAPEKNKSEKNYFALYVYQNDDVNTVSVSGTVKFETNNSVNMEKNGAVYEVK